MGKEVLPSLCPRGFEIEFRSVFFWRSLCETPDFLSSFALGFLLLVAVVLDALLCDLNRPNQVLKPI